MVDNNNEPQKVFYKEPMPPDFLRSEQVVVVGDYTEGCLHCGPDTYEMPIKIQGRINKG